MTPDQIQVLFKDVPEDEELRVQSLKPVLDTAQKLKVASPKELQALAEQVAIGSREERWRIPLGRSGLLELFLDLLNGDELDPDLIGYALRIIGNSCADQDENRQRVVDSGSLPQLVRLLTHESLLQFAIPVLFNICVDYEPAQAAASKAGLSKYIIDFLTNPQLEEKASSHMNIAYKLAGLAATQESEPDISVSQAPYVLLSRASPDVLSSDSADLDGYLGLSTTALAYLSHERFQAAFLATPHAIDVFLSAFQTAAQCAPEEVDADERAQLLRLQTTYTQTLADLSAHPLFAPLCPLDGALARQVLRWLSAPHPAPLQIAACLTLGNVSRADAPSAALVRGLSVHESLVRIVCAGSQAADAQLLHAVLSFLKNLSIPAGNKAAVGDAGALDAAALPRVWGMDAQPQIQFDGVSLARLLLVGCAPNVRRVCIPQGAGDRTALHQLMDLHRKADQDPIKMETARAAANVCRVLYSAKPVGSPLLPPPSSSPPSSSESLSLLQAFHAAHPALADTLLYLGQQTKFPVLRSELWFVLALMARSDAGASAVAGFLAHHQQQHPGVVPVLFETITGEEMALGPEAQNTSVGHDGPPEAPAPDLASLASGLGQLEPQQVDPARAATMTKVDRENGLVLISELLRRCPDELPASARNTFRQILKTGGGLVLDERRGS
ncbi:ARM repeat-containing protein [Jackrogersella minutella]|nr:ARM repeat-containing protein [Jackrogersella minutella]